MVGEGCLALTEIGLRSVVQKRSLPVSEAAKVHKSRIPSGNHSPLISVVNILGHLTKPTSFNNVKKGFEFRLRLPSVREAFHADLLSEMFLF
jgi:hypothetical protein